MYFSEGIISLTYIFFISCLCFALNSQDETGIFHAENHAQLLLKIFFAEEFGFIKLK